MAAALVRSKPWEIRAVASGKWICSECAVRRVSTSVVRKNGTGDDGLRTTMRRTQSSQTRIGIAASSLHTQHRARPRESAGQSWRRPRRREASESLTEPSGRTMREARGQFDRRARSSKQRHSLNQRSPAGWRLISTAATTADLHSIFEEEVVETDVPARISPDWQKTLGDIRSAIRHGAADALAKILSPARLQSGKLALLDDQLFTEILALWCSKNYFGNVIDQQLTMTDKMVEEMRMASLQQVVQEYLGMVSHVANSRRQAGARLSADQYAHILCAAHTAGSASVAQLFWDWMREDRVSPDAASYANYLGAHVWNDILPAYRERSHVTPFNMVAREGPYAGAPFDNYKARQDGIKEFVTSVLGELVRSGVPLNEEHICHVMVGLAREGDVKGMQRLLNRIWGIDVASILADNDNAPSKSLPLGSSLEPTDRLMSTLAFCYGINSNLPTALRVIDYVSRHYSLRPSSTVWDALLNWAYVLSCHRKVGSDFQPALDLDAVFRIWDTMQAPQYGITPSMQMFDKLIRTLAAATRPADMLAAMKLGLQLRHRERSAVGVAEGALQRANRESGDGSHEAVEQAQRALEHAHLAAQRNTKYLKTWMKLFLRLTDDVARLGAGVPVAEKMCYIDVPKLVKGSFIGRRVEYYTPTGHVEIRERFSEEEVLALHEKQARARKARKEALDVNRRVLGHEWIVRPWANRGLERKAAA